MTMDQEVRELFPQLAVSVRGNRLVYLDSGATALKPIPVIEAVRASLSQQTANVHRGAHFLSDQATEKYEQVRDKVQKFVGAADRREIVFTRGTTESINLLAQTLGRQLLQAGDEIVLSQMEHHSNIVPWQMIALEKGAKVRFAPVLDDGTIDQPAYLAMLSSKTRIVSLTHVSNVLGTVNPLKAMFEAAHKVGAVCVVDAAQSVSVMPIPVQELGCDFLTFSGHKMFAPMGIGILYGRLAWLEKLPPYQGGGSMIQEVREDGTSFLPPPHRFEAGTPAVSDIMGLGAAIDFINDLSLEKIDRHDRQILALAEKTLNSVDDFRQIGTGVNRCHVLSGLIGKIHPSDVGAILDEQGIAVRSGHHCCQPLMKRFGIPGTIRASFSVYTSEQDITALAKGLKKAKELLS